MSMSTTNNLEQALEAMTDPKNRALFDVTIICTTDDYQAEYWMDRLSNGICQKPTGEESLFPMVLAASEDWDEGGAGNGTGTLYAYQKACRLATDKFGVDLADLLLAKEISVALYHTAGKGTRLAPLPASENNNKPGVVRYIYYISFLISCYCFLFVCNPCALFRNYPFVIRYGMDRLLASLFLKR